jgi:hypothetical protein
VPRLAAPLIATALLATALLAGCGSSADGGGGGSTRQGPAPAPSGTSAPAGATAASCDAYAEDAEALRATAIPCDQARQVMFGWQRQPSCALPAGASRGSCLTRSYRCQSVRGGRGVAVSCARAGESIAFVAQRR